MYFSVIIPVYNIEKHINRCIKSVLAQTVSDFELILVDDGSFDQSGNICDYFAHLDERVKVIHKMNSGVSSTRNAGLMLATGKYIVFMDSDDFVDNTYLESMYAYDDDLIAVGFDDYEEDGTISKKFEFDNSFKELASDDDIIAYCKEPGWLFVWAKRYKKSIIDSNRIIFDESLTVYEDIIFNLQYIKEIRCVHLLDKGGYHHCQYNMQTLSTGKGELPLSKRAIWREKAIDVFNGHPVYQKYSAQDFLYFTECEFSRIASSPSSVKEKCRQISELVNTSCFIKCSNICRTYWRTEIKILLALRLYCIIYMRYR